MTEPISFAEVFARLTRSALGPDDVRVAFGAIFAGAWTPMQIGAFAAALRLRGERRRRSSRRRKRCERSMTGVEHGLDEVIDTCGTGGDGAHTLNVSTAAAIVSRRAAFTSRSTAIVRSRAGAGAQT